ncbi:MAG: hypothetical protein ACTSQJ_14495 [Promethearchaeota archaeon]
MAVDSWNPDADIIFVSHAHMDHIPIIPEVELKQLERGEKIIYFICSEITKEVAKLRTRDRFNFPELMWLLGKDLSRKNSINYNGIKLSVFNSGHTYGSLSLLIEGSESVFYTSDFIFNDFKYLEKEELVCGLKPVECNYLIMECTFGTPKYIFPSLDKIKNDLNDYIKKQFSDNYSVILLGYSFGKSQRILNLLDNYPRIILDRSIANVTKLLEKFGVKFNEWEPYGNYNKRQLVKLNDYILIIPPYSIYKEPYKTLIASGAKVVAFSGKVLDESYRKEIKADYYLPLSDHCDLNGLCNFIKESKFDKIYLKHGKISQFQYYLSKTIDFKNIKIFIL